MTLYAAFRYIEVDFQVDALDVGIISTKKEVVEEFVNNQKPEEFNELYDMCEFEDGEPHPFD